MEEQQEHHAASVDGLTISPSLDLVIDASQTPTSAAAIDLRVVWMCGLAIGLGLVAAFVAKILMSLIALVTNVSFYGRFSLDAVSPADNHLGLWVIAVPMVGGLIVGIMARYGSKAIRGHGIPEAMEQVLTNRSRIPARVTFLKPLSSAISIGTGGPFGAEGPIIATGGALGSLIGQVLHMTPSERKTLLAAGAAAGMAATFGSPVSAVLLAIELLLFEFRPRSIIPVALGSAAAAGMRVVLEGNAHPVFPMPDLDAPQLAALGFYVLLGAIMGVAAAAVTRIVYALEDAFERLPIHWMWWPTLGALVVGVVGYFSPKTLGVGYDNISAIISNSWATQFIAVLFVMKFISWSVSLSSGTSGGTLAPLFTIGGGLGHVIGAAAIAVLPAAHIDLRIAALVGMAAMFAGASRALLASTVFAFETTLQPLSLLPLLGGCTASYLVSMLVMKHSIMTEKIARRGVATPHEFTADPLEQVTVGAVASKPVVTLLTTQTVGEVRQWLAIDGPDAAHQGFPIVDSAGTLTGVLTRRDFFNHQLDAARQISELITRSPKFVYENCTVRQATDHMVRHGIGRLPVLTTTKPPRVVGMLTRSDILSVYRGGLEESASEAPTLKLPRLRRRDRPLDPGPTIRDSDRT
jgi:H+/Cl- antiporter ClcA/CBS domain-containing protein